MCGGNMVEKNLENKFNKWRSVYYSQNWGDKNMQNPPFLFGCNTIQKKDVWSKRPGTGIPSKNIPKILGKKFKKDLRKDQILTWKDLLI